MSEPRPRFVLLHHELADSSHWDLMLETGDRLATWQLLDDPRLLAGPGGPLSVRARSIGDHRRAYLDYEGPVSNNRGHVTRIDGGHYLTVERGAGMWRFELEGTLLKGIFELTPSANEWTFHRVSV